MDSPAVLTQRSNHPTLCLEGEALDRHTLDWAERANASGETYLTPAVLDGRWMVRVSIGAEATERADVARLWGMLRGLVG